MFDLYSLDIGGGVQFPVYSLYLTNYSLVEDAIRTKHSFFKDQSPVYYSVSVIKRAKSH
jgi:hypothetical protein